MDAHALKASLWLLLALPRTVAANDLPPVDFLKAYLAERHDHADSQILSDSQWSQLLQEPSHLPPHAYTEPAAYDSQRIDDTFRSAAARLDSPTRPLYLHEAWRMLQWDLGFTKARPEDVRLPHTTDDWGSEQAALNAIKAGVEADIFRQSIALFGNAHSTFAAKYAVAAQILRERIAATPEDKREVRNVEPEVLARFMTLPEGSPLDAYDAQYLGALLESEINRHTVARSSFRGIREIATPFRIARVAAAYRDNQSYVAPPCTDDFRYREGVASLDPRRGPVCFVDANDRAVYAWYNEAFRRQAGLVRESQAETSPLAKVLALLVPFGVMLDVLAAVEFTEALVTEDLAVSGEVAEEEAVAAEERAGGLMCRRF
jgi:hypothetical protein